MQDKKCMLPEKNDLFLIDLHGYREIIEEKQCQG